MTNHLDATDFSPTQTSSSFPYQNLLAFAQQVVSGVISLGVLFTASGFIIVNSYLAKFTDAFAYFILPTRYLTAGIGLWIIWIICILIIGPIIYRYIKRLQHVEKQMDMLATARNKTRLSSHILDFTIVLQLAGELRSYLQIQKRSFLWGMLIYLFVGGYVYGNVIYERIPHFLGGGVSPEVRILIKPDSSVWQIGLAPDPNHPQQTQSMKLLAELNNGLLLQDINTGIILAIYYEDIAAIVDTHSMSISSIVTP